MENNSKKTGIKILIGIVIIAIVLIIFAVINDVPENDVPWIRLRPTLVFVATERTDGNIGGRAGADAFCRANMPAGAIGQCRPDSIHAFLSVTENDEIRDMPTNFGFHENAPIYWIHSETGKLTRLADNWEYMLTTGPVIGDRTILTSPGEGTGKIVEVWTGAFIDGSLLLHCNAWTTSSVDINGVTADNSVALYSPWISWGHAIFCNSKLHLRCMCK